MRSPVFGFSPENKNGQYNIHCSLYRKKGQSLI
jgi:hypothetical protein